MPPWASRSGPTPLLLLRGALTKRGVVRSADLASVRDGARVRVAGLVLVRQRPGSAKGVMFLTLEDETGPSNIIVYQASSTGTAECCSRPA